MTTHRLRKIARRTIIVYALVVMVATLLPSDKFDDSFGRVVDWTKWLDLQKVAHALAYAGLAVLGVLSFAPPGRLRLGRAAGTLLGCTVFGAVLECGQALSPGRTPSVRDALVNAVGAMVGSIVIMALWPTVSRRLAPAAVPNRPPGCGGTGADAHGEAGADTEAAMTCLPANGKWQEPTLAAAACPAAGRRPTQGVKP